MRSCCIIQGAQPCALWWHRGVGRGLGWLWGRLKREGKICILMADSCYMAEVTQHCKAITFQLKINRYSLKVIINNDIRPLSFLWKMEKGKIHFQVHGPNRTLGAFPSSLWSHAHNSWSFHCSSCLSVACVLCYIIWWLIFSHIVSSSS